MYIHCTQMFKLNIQNTFKSRNVTFQKLTTRSVTGKIGFEAHMLCTYGDPESWRGTSWSIQINWITYPRPDIVELDLGWEGRREKGKQPAGGGGSAAGVPPAHKAGPPPWFDSYASINKARFQINPTQLGVTSDFMFRPQHSSLDTKLSTLIRCFK